MPDPALPPSTPTDPAPVTPKAAGLLQVVGAVFWSFFGVRKGRNMQQDAGTIKLHHVIMVGIALAAVFVLSLVALVTFITRHAS
jgi:hypothetical protein